MTDPSIINFASLEKASIVMDPFPFLVVSDFLRPESSDRLIKDFPRVDFPGSVLPGDLSYGSTFGKLLQELEGNGLRELIGRKFAIDLSNRPTLITVRGKTRKKDGQIHADTKSKIITLLLYFNPIWNAEGGRLRILRNGEDLEDYVQEIPPTFGTCLIFKVTDNCWHGHKPFEGERRAIQMNYLTDESALKQHLTKHHMSARLKSWKRWFSKGEH